MNLVQDILNGSQLAAGRLIRSIEDGDQAGYIALKDLYSHAGNAFIIGLTGPPGAGKSTLIDRLISEFRKNGEKVAVLACDPTSPITGGAILGDRIRMKRHSLDSGVFMRSIATRGALGGISKAVKGALIVLDAMRYNIILIETAGMGQIGADISLLAHMTIVLCIPGMGDGLQAMKAGILELADLYVVNKADLPGAEEVKNQLEIMLDFRGGETARRPDIVMVSAARDKGTAAILQAIRGQQTAIRNDEQMKRIIDDRMHLYLKSLIKELVAERLWEHVEHARAFQELVEAVKQHRIDPYSAARKIVNQMITP
jgi:LAO/AO transport system kinase